MSLALNNERLAGLYPLDVIEQICLKIAFTIIRPLTHIELYLTSITEKIAVPQKTPVKSLARITRNAWNRHNGYVSVLIAVNIADSTHIVSLRRKTVSISVATPSIRLEITPSIIVIAIAMVVRCIAALDKFEILKKVRFVPIKRLKLTRFKIAV